MSRAGPAVSIRRELPADRERVLAIHERAFGRSGEARLVERLRDCARPQISLVAEIAEIEGTTVVGHVFFSPVEVVDVNGEREHRSAIALGPIAVDPRRQRQGVGSRLCRGGLEVCLAIGEPVVFVLGHASYYPRFGFEPARPRGLHYKSAEFDPAFFVAELEPGSLDGLEGEVVYLAEFDEV